MPRRPRTSTVAQAWVELKADDPEAVSAHAVARARLAAGRGLARVRRLRVLELAGGRFERSEVEDLLHRSIQFYNPHKERCTVRTDPGAPAPVEPDEILVLVFERGHARRAAAERWWLGETGQAIEVREAVAWALIFEPAEGAASRAEELARLRTRRQGLFCNPLSQEMRVGASPPPLPWIATTEEVSA